MAVTLSLTSGHGPHPAVEVITDDPVARWMVTALAVFLRARPAWRGGGGFVLRIGHPRAVAESFVAATGIVSAERLESDAAMVWHPSGDRVLSQVGARLRQGGEAFRLGGDEFALLLVDHEAEGSGPPRE